MIYKDKKGETQQELVTTIPYTQAKSNNGNFVGMVIVEDLQGKFKKGYAYNEKGEVRKVYLDRTQIFRKINNFRTLFCQEIEMWGYNYWTDGQSEQYLIGTQIYCINYNSDEEEDGPGNNNENNDGSSGSTGGTDYNPPTGGNIATKIDLSLFDRLSYPVLGQIVDGLYNKVKNDPKLMAAIKNFSHLSEQQILNNLKTGQGPKLVVKDTPNIAGHYNPETNTIEIGRHLVTAGNYVLTSYSTALEFYIAVSILHEFIHFGENYTQIFLPHDGTFNDPGWLFENSMYGGRVFFNYVTGELNYEKIY